MKRAVHAGAVVFLVWLSSTLGAASSASDAPAEEIAGFTESEFVSAAIAAHVPREVAEAAWGDEQAMLHVPVTVAVRPGNSPAESSRAAANYTGVCYREGRNILNQILWKLSITKKWQVNSTVANVIPKSVGVGTTLSWGWSYQGLVNHSDHYSGSSHVSTRTGNFLNSFPDDYTQTVTVSIRANKNGTYVCS